MPLLSRFGSLAIRGWGSLYKSLISVLTTVTDPYSRSVSLWLSGDGTNAAQNNTFLDSSSNNFSITRFGNVTQGTFSPYGSNWSNYFNGASDWANSSANAAFALGSGDFTVECWAFISSVPNAYNAIYDNRLSGGSTAGFWIAVTSGRAIVCRNTSDFVSSGSNLITLNQWNHIAVVRSSTTMTIYLNGVSVGSASNSTNWTDNALWLNRVNDVTTLNGVQYLSNLRIVKGTAVYTSAFTPSTTPLTAISGTSLLTCQSNRFRDNSSNAFAITVNGTPSVQRWSPFSPTAAYSTSAIGGSGYFDGTGDNLQIPYSSTLAAGTGAYSFEVWVYFTSTGANQGILGTTGDGFAGFERSSSNWAYYYGTSGIGTGVPAVVGQWNHVVTCRNASGNGAFFVNGVRLATFTDTANKSGFGNLQIGYNGVAGGAYTNGYIAEYRYVKGTPYDPTQTTLTVPTAPLTAIANTVALINFTNAGISDSAMINNLETVGNAQISTSVKKYGTGSLAFDGSGDCNRIARNQPNLQFGTGDFTIEGWVYSTGSTGAFQHILTGGTSWTTGSGGVYWYYNSGSPYLGAAWNQITTNPAVKSGTLSINTWYHFAVVRSGNTLTLYVNGTSVSSLSVTGISMAVNNQNQTNIGGGGWDSDFAGYIDNLRVTLGYARYTSNFTPPAQAFGAQGQATSVSDPYSSYVVLWLSGDGANAAQNNTFTDSSSNNFAVTRLGNATQGPFNPYGSNWSNYFDGSYLTYTQPASAVPAPFTFLSGATGTGTFECWVYPLGSTQGANVYNVPPIIAVGSTYMSLSVTTTNKLRFYWWTGAANYLDSTINVPFNAWTHVAFVRNGSTITLYVNGITAGSVSFNGWSWGSGAEGSNLYLGYTAGSSITSYFTGYISNARVVNGSALYTGNFAPPTGPLTAIPGTSLLTCQSNRVIDNSSNNLALTVNLGAQISIERFSPFSPADYNTGVMGGSGYFNTSGASGLTVPQNTALNFDTGAFTVEAWVYITANNNSRMRIVGLGDGYWAGVSYSGWALQFKNSLAAISWYRYDGTETDLSAAFTFKTNTWYHIVAVRNGTSNLSMFVNGSRVYNNASASLSYNNVNSNPLYVGQSYDGAGGNSNKFFNGYITGARVVKGSAVYDPTVTTIAVPTAPLTAISGTSLLLNMTNAGITDNVMMADLGTVGNAQISTSVKKYGTGSLAFNGSSSLSQPSSNQYIFQVGDLTIEAWIYFNTVTSGTWCTTNVSGGFYWQYYSSAVQFGLAGGGAFVSSSWTPSASTWYHVATVRSGNTITHYINGTSIGSGTLIGAIYATTTLQIGTGAAGGSFNGYIDDFRITKGIARYTTNFTPPAQAFGALTQVATASDSYFRQVTLWLSGDGANGAQNNTFTDSSSNNFSITRNGNTTQGSFSPYGTNWSNYFNSAYLYFPSGVPALGTGNNTVEFWFYPTDSTVTYRAIYDGRSTGSTDTGYAILQYGLTIEVWGNGKKLGSAASAFATNTWTHVALVRTSGSCQLYINGVASGSAATYSSNLTSTLRGIGASSTGLAQPFVGYISNLREVTSALYSGTFTPSTTPLTAISGTNLLTCQSNRFVDASTNNLAYTLTGTPTVQRWSPFVPSAAYSASVIGGSGYFDGVGDSLTFTASSATSFAGDFTIEGWVYLLSYAGSSYNECTFLSLRSGLSTGTCFDWGRSNGANAGAIDWWHNGAAVCAGTAGDIPLNQWAHLAWVRSGSGTNNCKIYVNGALKAQGTNTTTMGISSGTGYIGNSMFDQTMTGYMSNLRISNAAVYTSNFTPPTTPLTAVTNTSLLLNMTNAGITDSAMINNLETIGNAQISTSVVKYGTGSMYLPNTSTSDYLVSPINGQLSGNFTLEMWLYPTSIVSGNAFLYSIGAEVSSRFAFYLKNGVPYLNIYRDAETALGSTALSATTWSHLAFVRYGSTITAYINGTNVGSTTSYTGTLGASSLVYIGSESGATSKYKGYIDDLRITQGYARYTSNFTPPDALPNTQ